MTIIIRNEQPGDEQVIHDLTVKAFEPMPYSNGSEAPIIAGLRQDGDLAVSLVAVEGVDIVGHIAFSPVTIRGAGAGAGWYGLGPVSVWPHRQKQGIGSALVKKGLSILRDRGAQGCVLVGDPNYYERFGFRCDGTLAYQELPSAYIQSLPFGDAAASGELKFSPAFER